MGEAERCFASTQNREPGPRNFASVDEQNIPDHKGRIGARRRESESGKFSVENYTGPQVKYIAGMAKLADALALGASESNLMGVQVSPPAQEKYPYF